MTDATLCPNCDGIMNALHCTSCGWKPGEPIVRDVATWPYQPGARYAASKAPEPEPWRKRKWTPDTSSDKIQ